MTDASFLDRPFPWYVLPLPVKDIEPESYFGCQMERALRLAPPTGERVFVPIGNRMTIMFQHDEDRQKFAKHLGEVDLDRGFLVPTFADLKESMDQSAMTSFTFVRASYQNKTFGIDMQRLWNWMIDNCTGRLWTVSGGLLFEREDDAMLFQMSVFEKDKPASEGLARISRAKGTTTTCAGCGFGIEPTRRVRGLETCASCERHGRA